MPAHRRDRLEHLARYLLRPPLALERLTESSGGQLLYQFRRPWSDGSMALLLDSLELLERLAALVPRPRTHLLVYHGLLAPRAWWRSAVMPRPARDEARPAGPEGSRSPSRLPWATLLRRVFAIEVLVCPRCGGPRRIVGPVTEPQAVRRLLGALGAGGPAVAAPFRHRLVTNVDPGDHPAAVPVCPPTRGGRLSPTSPHVHPGPLWPLPGRPAAR